MYEKKNKTTSMPFQMDNLLSEVLRTVIDGGIQILHLTRYLYDYITFANVFRVASVLGSTKKKSNNRIVSYLP